MRRRAHDPASRMFSRQSWKPSCTTIISSQTNCPGGMHGELTSRVSAALIYVRQSTTRTSSGFERLTKGYLRVAPISAAYMAASCLRLAAAPCSCQLAAYIVTSLQYCSQKLATMAASAPCIQTRSGRVSSVSRCSLCAMVGPISCERYDTVWSHRLMYHSFDVYHTQRRYATSALPFGFAQSGGADLLERNDTDIG
jgi:hypothetical protein